MANRTKTKGGRKRIKKKKQNITLPSKITAKQKEDIHKYLDSIYYNTSSGGAYSSPSKLLKEVKRRGY